MISFALLSVVRLKTLLQQYDEAKTLEPRPLGSFSKPVSVISDALVTLNRLAPRLRGIKQQQQQKSHQGGGMKNSLLLFYSPKPRGQPRMTFILYMYIEIGSLYTASITVQYSVY